MADNVGIAVTAVNGLPSLPTFTTNIRQTVDGG
jgi:hypothetical protein